MMIDISSAKRVIAKNHTESIGLLRKNLSGKKKQLD